MADKCFQETHRSESCKSLAAQLQIVSSFVELVVSGMNFFFVVSARSVGCELAIIKWLRAQWLFLHHWEHEKESPKRWYKLSLHHSFVLPTLFLLLFDLQPTASGQKQPNTQLRACWRIPPYGKYLWPVCPDLHLFNCPIFHTKRYWKIIPLWHTFCLVFNPQPQPQCECSIRTHKVSIQMSTKNWHTWINLPRKFAWRNPPQI